MNTPTAIATIIALALIGLSLLITGRVELSKGLETTLASAIAFSIWGVALVVAYKVLEIWWRTRLGKWLLKISPFSEVTIKGLAVLALIIIAFYLIAVIAVFLHDELGFFR
ncbi:hypothetical protein A3D81_00785 [Candidatus Curtissbacteria bacterium RIFCSPHIGHO2_02_FULL_40_17]|uniref:Uncharacterized protein n=4 Tax=Patescibacteria group TaxID=1783273 RepID=A0A1G2HGQ3_9BACT|nr:MAG: hypothetical protein A3D81_00785 [Candidatus Curtissbacteria bacterium RIFCSPHIGHO2_02_FULL_40_17]OGE03850.1 MAG: hypothetical protein A3F45_01100 [Candidatus Curtissbacteria bacterium RIFCSPHIGHO2_12_FULL_41_17]OGE05926.1 MAG: hypothetical protein A3I53_02275 [Candidatus Curtissbacteria bacterium RIFCSPLOWO2_02_FULL_40_13b]OGZ61559.1 MAG: hypothetical protein A3F94_00255 [Candidatus Spechtbacteria bacterium RIFCSPLOWO2_12_FULL_38_22]